jgi:hypothetical protein
MLRLPPRSVLIGQASYTIVDLFSFYVISLPIIKRTEIQVMKKIILFSLFIIPLFAFTQEKKKPLSEETIRRVSVGAEIYQDFWMKWPAGMNVRAINQGGSGFIMYNVPFGKSPVTFSIGAGISCHNLFSNTTINDIHADTITFTPIPDSIDYKKSKLGLTYLDFPIELRFVTKDKIRFSVGVKLGYLLDGKTKYKGDDADGYQSTVKYRKVEHLDKFQFGPTIRFGYDWFQVSAYYSVTQIFEKGLGPDLYPFSVGFTFMPF